jgi:hypothetical protein
VPIAVAFEKELRANHSALVDNESPRVRHSLRLAFGRLVEDVVILDCLAPGIRQERERDLRLVGKPLENRRLVIADADDMDPGFLD